ncbi:MAG TPA: hypothetical protein PKC18_02690 [Lacipirellulaceae bacterium]|nr:hypothetical protein [Lacipirellulaceae bacterium]
MLRVLVDELRRDGLQRIPLGAWLGDESSCRARHGARKLGSIAAVRSLGCTACLPSGQVRRVSPRAVTRGQPVRLVVDQGPRL